MGKYGCVFGYKDKKELDHFIRKEKRRVCVLGLQNRLFKVKAVLPLPARAALPDFIIPRPAR